MPEEVQVSACTVWTRYIPVVCAVVRTKDFSQLLSMDIN